jgi:hypothetical protein
MPIKTVLIIDDSPTERHILSQLLLSGGYEVSTAESGEEGIERAKQIKPDLILMDVVMPGTNGFQATRALSRDEATKNDSSHHLHHQGPGNRQGLGHAPGCPGLRDQAGRWSSAAGQDRRAGLKALWPSASVCANSSKAFPNAWSPPDAARADTPCSASSPARRTFPAAATG